MNSITKKIIALSFLVLSAACSEKPATEQENQEKKQENVSQKNGDKKDVQIRFKAVPLPDKSTYKNPTF